MTMLLERRRRAATRTLSVFCDALFGGAAAMVLACAALATAGAAQLALSPSAIAVVLLASLSVSLPICLLLARLRAPLAEQLRLLADDSPRSHPSEADALLPGSAESSSFEDGLRALSARLMRCSMLVAFFLPTIPSALGALAWLLSLSAISIALNVLGFVAGVGTHVARQFVRISVDRLLSPPSEHSAAKTPSSPDLV